MEKQVFGCSASEREMVGKSLDKTQLNNPERRNSSMGIEELKQFTLGLNELRDSYTMRVFDVDGKERYDTATIAMREATEEDLAAFPSAD